MKHLIYILSTIYLIALVQLTGCGDIIKDLNDGRNEMSFTHNGQNINLRGTLPATTSTNSKRTTINISNDSHAVRIIIQAANKGTFDQVTATDLSVCSIEFIDRTGPSAISYFGNVGSVSITDFSTSSKKIKGTFTWTLIQSGTNNQVNSAITNGKFDMQMTGS